MDENPVVCLNAERWNAERRNAECQPNAEQQPNAECRKNRTYYT
jgi:hypothetical protein